MVHLKLITTTAIKLSEDRVDESFFLIGIQTKFGGRAKLP